jgi:plasmid stabilization system protein ParE
LLSKEGEADLDEILAYLDSMPDGPASRFGQGLFKTLNSIAEYPLLGAPHSSLTRLLGTEVRSRLCLPYRIYYRLDKAVPEVLAIVHTARDTAAVLADRLQ